MNTGPVILIDVDGVLNPFTRPNRSYRRHRVSPDGVTFKLWLNAAHGRMLLELAEETGAELAWGSYWCDSANEWIAPRIGLPDPLPHVPIPRFPGEVAGGTLGAWKARHVADWAAGRPFVWFEDEPDVAERLTDLLHVGPHLLVSVNPLKGLLEGHLDRARAWLTALRADPSESGAS
ncbi:hypothetical protein DPM19_03735 [Actinomadura craniellae]|uniref:Secreted protein n=1 Tax=Actinomadura craniellae TaxID=2231787 RepID=A0A365HAD1_9ACTN|nr:HAD domain-containing protein [Actinomadura craniellae]RAY16057.1 hypothetical protein DPM19_03735 [Actinomadura craniellae]